MRSRHVASVIQSHALLKSWTKNRLSSFVSLLGPLQFEGDNAEAIELYTLVPNDGCCGRAVAGAGNKPSPWPDENGQGINQSVLE